MEAQVKQLQQHVEALTVFGGDKQVFKAAGRFVSAHVLGALGQERFRSLAEYVKHEFELSVTKVPIALGINSVQRVDSRQRHVFPASGLEVHSVLDTFKNCSYMEAFFVASSFFRRIQRSSFHNIG